MNQSAHESQAKLSSALSDDEPVCPRPSSNQIGSSDLGNPFEGVRIPPDSVEKVGKEVIRRVEQFENTSTLARSEHGVSVKALCWSDMELGRLLGSGSFSRVYEATIRRDCVQPAPLYAVKCLRQEITEQTELFTTGAVDLALEAEILAKLVHPNIIRLHGSTSSCAMESFREGAGIFIVLDLLVDTLDKRLARWRRFKTSSPWILRFDKQDKRQPNRIKDVALGVAQGLAYLHSKKIMYRDLKPQNIGFDDKGIVRIFDFGLAREADSLGKLRHMTGDAGTPRYMAPELFRDESKSGFSSDVYSYSILLWEILTLSKPFGAIKTLAHFQEEVVRRNARPPLKRVSSPKLKTLLQEGWDSDEANRPTFTSVCETLQQELSMTEANAFTLKSQGSMYSTRGTDVSRGTHTPHQDETNRWFPHFSPRFERSSGPMAASNSSYKKTTWIQRILLRQSSMSATLLTCSRVPENDLGEPSASYHGSQGERSESFGGSGRFSERNKNAMTEALAAEVKANKRDLRQFACYSRLTRQNHG